MLRVFRWSLLGLIALILLLEACARHPVAVAARPLTAEELAEELARPPATAPPVVPYGVAMLPLPPDVAFQQIIDALVARNIIVAATMKDSGLIRTGRVVVRNINRSSGGAALKCGFQLGARVAPSYDCMDFAAEYQILIRPQTPGASQMTVSATAIGVNVNGFRAGAISDPWVLAQLAERMKTSLMQSLPPPPPAPLRQEAPAVSEAPSLAPDWCRGDNLWKGDHCEVGGAKK